MLGSQNQKPFSAQLGRHFAKRFFDVFQIAVIIQVVIVYVGDDYNFRIGYSKRFLYRRGFNYKMISFPATKLLLESWSKLPTMMVGSNLASMIIWPIIAVVVVLPCAPETAMVYLSSAPTPAFPDRKKTDV